jgi:GTPase
MFVDRIVVQLRAGKGGDGIVAWRREKFIPKGGPSGGNGGDGGSIEIVADHDTYSLEGFRNLSIIRAENGAQGQGANKQGKRGTNLTLKVPIGTLLKDAETGTLLYDFTVDKESFTVCLGGRGGRGNVSFKTSTNRTPQKCTPGKLGEEKDIELELKLIADVGIVGFPNAGKSTFLSKATSVPVKIAPYPFTTLKPNLGYIYGEYGHKILLADIPGIIPDAHLNKGLGIEFLRHIERTKVLLFVIDISGSEGRDPVEDFQILKREISSYNADLLDKPFLIALNKIDMEGAQENSKVFQKLYPDTFLISAKTGEGFSYLLEDLKRKLSK